MLGILITSIGTFFDELSILLGKRAVAHNHETLYSMAFLGSFWTMIWFIGLTVSTPAIHFSLASVPLVIIRNIFEVILLFVSSHAVIRADRSTFGFIRTGTIPLLLLVDALFGYSITYPQIGGICMVLVLLFLAFKNHGISRTGAGITALSTILSVITIALYKFNITHYNSVEIEQLISATILSIASFIAAIVWGHENPFRILRTRDGFIQSFAAGIGSVILSFAYLFGAASLITAAKRATSVAWAILSGNQYFKEKGLVLKLTLLAGILAGLLLLM